MISMALARQTQAGTSSFTRPTTRYSSNSFSSFSSSSSPDPSISSSSGRLMTLSDHLSVLNQRPHIASRVSSWSRGTTAVNNSSFAASSGDRGVVYSGQIRARYATAPSDTAPDSVSVVNTRTFSDVDRYRRLLSRS